MRNNVVTDLQKSRVYRWESINVAPFDRTKVQFKSIESVVHYVWESEGYRYPPLVELLPSRCSKRLGDATRCVVRFREETQTWIILHELAHSMTSEADGASNVHGALFMGIYCHLLSKYMRMDYTTLKLSARKFGLKVSDNTLAVFA